MFSVNGLIIGVCILTILYICLIIIYNYGWHKSLWTAHRSVANHTHTFSIIIPARNEEQNIINLLKSILQNDYPKSAYEIIVIDDFSNDNTAIKVNHFIAHHPQANIRLLQLSEYLNIDERIVAFKKKALDIAIRQSKHDHIITIDADCLVTPKWLQEYNLSFQPAHILFVAGPVKFIKPEKSSRLLFYFQDLDFTMMQGITPAANYLGLGNMCNGANLGFQKKAFFDVNGYQDINHMASGDDMMLMHKFKTHYGRCIGYIHSRNGIVYSYAQETWEELWHQRVRWASKSGKYSDTALNLSLGLVYIFNVAIIITAICALVFPYLWSLFLYILFVKIVIELAFLVALSRFYNNVLSLVYFPFLQPLHILYIVSVGFMGMIGKYKWKGRAVK